MAPRKKARRNKAPGKKAASKSRRAKAGTARAAATATTEAAWKKASGKPSPTSRKKAVKKAAAKTSTAKKATARKATARKATARKATARKVAPRKAAAAKKAAAKKTAPRRASRKTASRGKGHSAHIAVKRDGIDQSALLGELEALAAMMDTHGLFEVSYELDSDGSKRIHVSRNGSPMLATAAPMAAASAPAALAAPAPAAAAAAPAATEAPGDEGLVPFPSPMVGTFYRAASPEVSAFVAVGDQVDPSSVVCIIEAMKVMNEINPEISGEVVSIEVENGEAVEFGQTLMLLRPR